MPGLRSEHYNYNYIFIRCSPCLLLCLFWIRLQSDSMPLSPARASGTSSESSPSTRPAIRNPPRTPSRTSADTRTVREGQAKVKAKPIHGDLCFQCRRPSTRARRDPKRAGRPGPRAGRSNAKAVRANSVIENDDKLQCVCCCQLL